MVTLALRSSRFSSCRALHLSLNVSSSIFSTLFSCCREARRLVSSSRRNWEMTTLGLPELLDAEEDIGVAELLPAPSVSLSLALSAMAHSLSRSVSVCLSVCVCAVCLSVGGCVCVWWRRRVLLLLLLEKPRTFAMGTPL